MNKKQKIAFLGNFAKEKGSEVFKEIVKKLSLNDFEFYIFGFIGDSKSFKEIKNKLNHVEAYTCGKLPNLLKKYKIDLGICPSLFPETFHKVFFEAINSCDIIIPYYTFPAFLNPKYPYIVKFKTKKDMVKNIIKLIYKHRKNSLKYNHIFYNKIDFLKIINTKSFKMIEEILS